MIVDGQHRELGADRYLLSPGDLYAIGQVPQLVQIGVACLKIEGRYKDENYVALTTAAYRQAIDAACQPATAAEKPAADTLPQVSKDQLEQVYSRGLGPHFMGGVNHQSVVAARAPRHRGLQVGQVLQVDERSVTVRMDHEIRPGDGLLFDAADWRSPDEPEEGGNVYQVQHRVEGTVLRFGSGEIDYLRIRRGDLVWRTSDPQLFVQLKPLARPKAISRTQPLHFKIHAEPDRPLIVEGRTQQGLRAEVHSIDKLKLAHKQGLNRQQMETHLGRLGGTPFHLGQLEWQRQGDPRLFLPVSQLNDLRRRIVEDLLRQRRSNLLQRTVHPGQVQNWLERHPAIQNSGSLKRPQLNVLVRSAEQLDAAIACRPASITLDYLELYGLRPSVERVKQAGLSARVASPRILKPAEQNVVRFLLSLECPILVRSGGLLQDLLQIPQAERPELIGDFSLNAANVVSARSYLEMGLKRLTPTYDLNARQIEDLCRRVEADCLEVIAYSHLPVFHTEHCVFCRFMSQGTDHTNCGHPCEKHQVALRDQNGRLHPVMADVGCRNTVFGAEAQVSPLAIPQWLRAGLTEFRLEFVHETGGQVAQVFQLFQQALSQQLDFSQLSGNAGSRRSCGHYGRQLFRTSTTERRIAAKEQVRGRKRLTRGSSSRRSAPFCQIEKTSIVSRPAKA